MHNFHCRENENIKNYANKINFSLLHPDDKFHQKKGDNIFSFFLVSLFPYFEMCVLNEKKANKNVPSFFFPFSTLFSQWKRDRKRNILFFVKETLTNFT